MFLKLTILLNESQFFNIFHNKERYLNKKAIHLKGEKLFIGLTTKPFRFYSELNNTTIFDAFMGQKSIPISQNASSQFSGLDGTRTRDPMRDRHVF